MKAAILSFFTLSAIAFWAIGIYSADAGSNRTVVDGYGVVAKSQHR